MTRTGPGAVPKHVARPRGGGAPAGGDVSAGDAAAQAEIAAAVAGDQGAFARLAERHRRELHVHCYRMLASFDEAEDAVQETFLNAWRARGGFDGSLLFRAWLYRIATNVCLDLLRRNARRLAQQQSFADVPWLQPYPDRLLDQAAPSVQQPEAVAVERETIELAFLAAMQLLPARQRAAFIVRDVLGWPADQTAALLGTSVAAANSALQRARVTMQQHLASRRAEWTAPTLTAQDRALLERFIDAHERCDAAAAVAITAQDVRITMPPYPWLFDGIDAMRTLLERAFGEGREGEWKLLPTAANRMPAAASYLLRPGDTRYRAFKLDVLRVRDGLIAEATTFGPALFPEFGLPEDIPAE
jgi:RNA polymerase sigma-70 factor (TIGR02960 family)